MTIKWLWWLLPWSAGVGCWKIIYDYIPSSLVETWWAFPAFITLVLIVILSIIIALDKIEGF